VRPGRVLTAGVAALGLLSVGAASASGRAVVYRVGPPSWWAEPVEQKLMLLIEGAGLDGAAVRFVDGPVRVDRVEARPGGRAVFVEVTIPAGAGPQAGCRLAVAAGGETVERRWDLLAKPTRAASPVGNDDVIYLVMPDRFADGDPSNNEAGTVGPPMLNRADPQAYHGGDFAGLRARLATLADLGVTAVWLTPIYKPSGEWFAPGDGKKRFADFHGYSPVDFYETDPRFGSRAEYKALVDEAHRHGLKVIQDHVLGHAGPKHPWVASPPTPRWINGPPDRPRVCDFRFDLAADPHAPESARRGLTDGWFAGILPDLNLREDRAAAYAIQQSLWWATLFEADGVRLDTYPMVARTFWPVWTRRMNEARPGLRAIGEAWTVDAANLAFFQGGRPGWDGVDPGIASVFDFPLHAAIQAVFAGKAPASDLARALARDGLYPRPELLTTFLDNHDTVRLAAVPGVTPARLRLAAAFLLTTRGTPQMTWGDELGMVGHLDDRREYPGGFPGDPRDASSPTGRTPEEQAIFAAYRDLLRVRRETPALRRGHLTNLVADASTYVYRREIDGESAIVALNLGDQPARVTLDPEQAGPAPECLLGPGRWVDAPSGPQLDLPAGSASIFRKPAR